MEVALSSDIKDMAQRCVLCWLATVDETGQPNVSPKEVFAVINNDHLVIANIASPGSGRNIRIQPKVCVSFVDVFIQKGYKVYGEATEIKPDSTDFAQWVQPLTAMVGNRFRIQSVFVVRATAVHDIVAPSYRIYPDETTEAGQIQTAMRSYGVRPLSN